MTVTIKSKNRAPEIAYCETPSSIFNGEILLNEGFASGTLANIYPDIEMDKELTDEFTQMAHAMGELSRHSWDKPKEGKSKLFKLSRGGWLEPASMVKGKTLDKYLDTEAFILAGRLEDKFSHCITKLKKDIQRLPPALQKVAKVRVYDGEFSPNNAAFNCASIHTHEAPTFIKTYTPEEATLLGQGKELPPQSDVYFSGQLRHASPCSKSPRVVLISFAEHAFEIN